MEFDRGFGHLHREVIGTTTTREALPCSSFRRCVNTTYLGPVAMASWPACLSLVSSELLMMPGHSEIQQGTHAY